MILGRLSLSLAAIILVSGCAQITLTLPYAPQSTEELKGTVDVAEFKYFPREGIAQNEIRETAAGRIHLTENIGIFFSNAVRREFRQSGLSLRPNGNCYLDGEVNEFLVD